MATSNWLANLIEQVESVTTQPPTTQDESIAYYQKMWPGEMKVRGREVPAWREHLVSDLQALTGLSRSTILRRFQARNTQVKKTTRNVKPKSAQDYVQLGLTLDPLPPQFGYHVEFSGWVNFSHCEKRQFSVDITSPFSEQVARNPTLIMDTILLIYMEEEDNEKPLREQTPSVGVCVKGDEAGVNDPKVEVTANEKKTPQGHSGRERRFSFFSKKP